MRLSEATKLPFCALLLIACCVSGSAIAQNAVVVNNTPIPSSRVDAFIKALVAQGRPDTPELRTMVREELISRELFVQEAEARKLSASEDVENRLIKARQDILIQALILDELTNKPVSEEDIKKAYDDRIANEKGEKEYRASHILVEDEAEAKKIIAELDKGGDFKALAKKSKDPGSAKRGGDLDWNRPDTFVPPFTEAMTALEKGKYTKEPVKTDFGYHVIRLDDVREALPPGLDTVKPQIKQNIERERVIELQKALRTKAKIQ